MAGETVSATTIINAPAEAIFAVLADPARHAEIDGTGWVREPAGSQPLTAAGQMFGMAMYHAGHPGRKLPDGQPGAGVRPAARHLLGAGPGHRRRQPAVRRLGLALRPGPVRDHGHPVLRLAGGPQLPPPAHRIPRSLRITWATRCLTSPAWSPRDRAAGQAPPSPPAWPGLLAGAGRSRACHPWSSSPG
jgi:hypothetical protein